VRDPAELRAHTDGKHERSPLAGDDGGASKKDVAGIDQMLQIARPGVAGQGNRLTGDGGIVHPHAERLHQSAVRRHVVALFEQYDIAGNELLGVHFHYAAAPQDLDLLWQQLLQRGQGALGAVLLPEREDGADDDDGDDGLAHLRHALTRVLPIADKGERRGDPENDGEEMGELFEQPYR
jgi:hypothetical protein